jgi:hypothetical protein
MASGCTDGDPGQTPAVLERLRAWVGISGPNGANGHSTQP